MIDEWKNITGYEGLYQVSNLGRVKSLRYNKILKPYVNERGYVYVLLVDRDGHNKNWRLHRLVAQTFLPNPDNLPQINHKDEDKSNNCADNLELCTAKHNANYGIRGHKISLKKGTACICTDNGVIYRSIKDASKRTGLNEACISACCRGVRPHTRGTHWRYWEGGDARCPSV